MHGNRNRVIVTRYGRHARQLHFSYNTQRSRKRRRNETMDENNQQGVDEMARQRQEILAEQNRLRALREELESMRNNMQAQQEIMNRQRQELARQAQQPLNLAREIQRTEPAIAVADVGNIISSINNAQISITFPKFDNEHSKNPVEFLNEFDKYCLIKQINNENKKILISQCFTGKARTWANSRGDFQTFDAFRAAFLDEFYSIPVRANRKKRWLSKVYDPEKSSYQSFFYSQLRESEYFIPRLTPYEVNYIIVTQLPNYVMSSLALVNFENSNAVAQAITILDASKNQKHIPRNNYKSNYQNNTNHNNNSNFHTNRRQTDNHDISYNNRNNYQRQNSVQVRNYQGRNFNSSNFSRNFRGPAREDRRRNEINTIQCFHDTNYRRDEANDTRYASNPMYSGQQHTHTIPRENIAAQVNNHTISPTRETNAYPMPSSTSNTRSSNQNNFPSCSNPKN